MTDRITEIRARHAAWGDFEVFTKHGGVAGVHEDRDYLLDQIAERDAEIAALAEAAGPCSSGRDGECYGDNCPQEHDDRKNYRSYCPRARYWEAKQEEEV